jgi:hypothetical protein
LKEIFKVTINNFNEYVKISEKRQVKPFYKGKRKIPKKYQSDSYTWDGKGRLVDKLTNKIIPSNPRVAGQKRYWRINGQDIYNQKISHSGRHSIMSRLHDLFNPHLKDLDKIEEKYITLKIEFHVLDQDLVAGKEKNIDNDNRWIYGKAIRDCLRDLGKIPDDDPHNIKGDWSETNFVENKEDCKLVIIGYGKE